MTFYLHLALNLLLIGLPVIALFVWLMPHRVTYFAVLGALVIAFPFALDLGLKGVTSATGAMVLLYMGLLALCFLIAHGVGVGRVVLRRRRRVASRLPSAVAMHLDRQ